MRNATARSLTGLVNDLNDDELLALTDSVNRPLLKEFLAERIKAALPIEMTLGGRTYDILGFLQGDEKFVKGDVMVSRAKEMNAHQGKEEREHVLKYQDEIPAALRGKVVFVFTDDRHPGSPENVYYVYWRGGCWVKSWHWLVDGWSGFYRVLRRK